MARLEISLKVIMDNFEIIGFLDEDEASEVVRATLERELAEDVSVSVQDYYLIDEEGEFSDDFKAGYGI